MTRFFKAKELFGTYPVMKSHCPGNFQTGPFLDRKTFYNHGVEMGCRGTSCRECWDTEYDDIAEAN